MTLLKKNRHPDYCRELAGIITGNLAPGKIAQELENYHEKDIAATMEALTAEQRRKLYSLLSDRALAEVLDYAEDPGLYLKELSIPRQVKVLEVVEVSVAAEYLQNLDRPNRENLMGMMKEEPRLAVARVCSFDEEEIGSTMTANFISIPEGISVKEAMSSLVSQAAEHDNISTIYVTDHDGVFRGAIDLKDLIIARKDGNLESITASSYPYVYAHERVDDCLELLRDYSEDSIPVLDDENRLAGVLTASDVGELIHDAMGDDYARLGGLAQQEDLREPIRKSVAKRIPWLFALLLLGMVVSSVVGAFEAVVAQLAVVVCFQSLILDMAGNVGTQTLAVTIRVLMEEQVGRKEKLSLIWKEIRVGLINGLLLGALSVGAVGLYLYFFKGQEMQMSFMISGCVGASLMIAMVISSGVGTVVPIFFKALKVDPAVASGPLITTLNDLVAVVTYYGLAWLFLIRTMG